MINKMTNTNNIMIPRFITLTPINEQFESRFNAMHIIDYASNGKNCVVHVLQGSVIKTIVVEESVQDIMKLIGDE